MLLVSRHQPSGGIELSARYNASHVEAVGEQKPLELPLSGAAKGVENNSLLKDFLSTKPPSPSEQQGLL